MHIAIPKPEPNPGYFLTSLHKANRCVKWIKVLTKVTERVLQKGQTPETCQVTGFLEPLNHPRSSSEGAVLKSTATLTAL